MKIEKLFYTFSKRTDAYVSVRLLFKNIPRPSPRIPSDKKLVFEISLSIDKRGKELI
jgi:hypothetical protein